MEAKDLPGILQKFFHSHGLPVKGSRYLVGVSGGLDSVVLCHLCHEAGMDIVIAHANFNLRGEESKRDEDFVQALAAKLGRPVETASLDAAAYADAHRCSVQEAARDLRYAWFDELRVKHQCTHTLLAHHADDAVETMVMHFFRGTGLQGLASIPAYNRERKLLRPLLDVPKVVLTKYAEAQLLPWVEDSSNLSDKYTRNFFRNSVLPLVVQVYPETASNLYQNLQRFRSTNAFYMTAMEKLKESLVERVGDTVRIPVLKWKQHLHTPLTYEIIRDFGFGEKQVPDVERLLHGDTGKYIENAQYQVIRHRRWIVIAPRRQDAAMIAIPPGQEWVSFADGQLHFDKQHATAISTDPKQACLDSAQVQFPLILRKWKAGDYFYPLGMHKKKKLSRFFIDARLSKADKEKVWVLESDKRIIWVVGMRIDDRFKVTGTTQEMLQVSWTSPSS